MPVIDVFLNEFENLLGEKLDRDKLEELFMNLKMEIDEIEGDLMRVEVKDFYRIDLFSTAGIAKEVRKYLRKEFKEYKVHNSDNYTIYVDNELKDIRPYIVSAVIKNVKLNENRIKDLIQLQEKICGSFGRNRKKIAIGFHNLDLIEFPIYYKAVEPDKVKFIPLNHNKEMNLLEILENTESGKKYKYILEGKKKFPILIDSKGNVISFPPIINSNRIGRVTENTKNLFLDITGYDLNSLLYALNAFLITLYEYGGEVYNVKIVYEDRVIFTPDIKLLEKEFNFEKIKKRLGLNLSNEEIVELLKRREILANIYENKIKIKYWNYRFDILSENDIIEEILISYGYNKLMPKKVNLYTKGSLSNRRKIINKIREIMVASGFREVYTTVLVNYEINSIFNYKGEIVKLKNYVSQNYNSVRSNLFSSIFQILMENPYLKLPEKLFEVGRVAYLEGKKVVEEDCLSFYIINNEVNVNEIISYLDSLFSKLNLNFEIKNKNYKMFIEGRSGEIFVNNKFVGVLGEVNPEILEKLDIKYPITMAEISLSKIKDDIGNRI